MYLELFTTKRILICAFELNYQRMVTLILSFYLNIPVSKNCIFCLNHA